MQPNISSYANPGYDPQSESAYLEPTESPTEPPPHELEIADDSLPPGHDTTRQIDEQYLHTNGLDNATRDPHDERIDMDAGQGYPGHEGHSGQGQGRNGSHPDYDQPIPGSPRDYVNTQADPQRNQQRGGNEHQYQARW